MPTTERLARLITAGSLPGVYLTVGEYLTDWITARLMDDNTRRSYLGHVRNHLIPHLGHLRLDQLSPTDIDAMFIAVASRNQHILDCRSSPDPAVRATVTGIKPTGLVTQDRILATLRVALNEAIKKRRLLTINPAKYV